MSNKEALEIFYWNMNEILIRNNGWHNQRDGVNRIDKMGYKGERMCRNHFEMLTKVKGTTGWWCSKAEQETQKKESF